MPAKNPRMTTVLEKPLYALLVRKAKKDGVSLSVEARDLIRQALSDSEEAYWAREADQRLSTLDSKRVVAHQQFWKSLGL